MKYSHIIWDWNGTLFDDLAWCIRVINQILEKRRLKKFSGISDYHAAFGFPISEYYKKIGLNPDEETFKTSAQEFIDLYHSNKSGNCKLHTGALEVIREIHKNAISQIILSASEQKNLMRQIDSFGIEKYFDEILGISNIYASSKIEIGRQFMIRAKVKRAVLIGDTAHDFDVAKSIGADCILIANGHQSKATLSHFDVTVVNDIKNILNLLF